MVAEAPKFKHKPTRIAPSDLLRHLTPERLRVMHEKFNLVLESLVNVLGPPFYADSGFILYHGDCIEVMREVAKSSTRAALCLTSPPYNIGKEYEQRLSIEDYVQWCTKWMAGVKSIAEQNSAFWLNLGYVEVPGVGKRVPLPYLLWDTLPFYLQQEVVWHYSAGVTSKKRFAPRNEKWLFCTEHPTKYTFNLDEVRDPDVKYPHQRKNGKLRCNPLGKNPGDVWQFPKVTSGKNRSSKERTSHPAQFPLAVISDIVKVSSMPADLVFDPFTGSGSTGVASVGNGRVFMGIEIRKDYREMARQRFIAFESERQATPTSLFLSNSWETFQVL